MLFRKPSSVVIAQQDLEEMQRQLLEIKANREYYVHMEGCLEERIARLKAYVKNPGE
jgi:hypothetical protein